jgi:hypothetical protein
MKSHLKTIQIQIPELQINKPLSNHQLLILQIIQQLHQNQIKHHQVKFQIVVRLLHPLIHLGVLKNRSQSIQPSLSSFQNKCLTFTSLNIKHVETIQIQT